MNESKYGVIYQTNCNECEATYNSETERAVTLPYSGPQCMLIKSKDSRTPTPHTQHMRDALPELDTSYVIVIDRDIRWFERGV